MTTQPQSVSNAAQPTHVQKDTNCNLCPVSSLAFSIIFLVVGVCISKYLKSSIAAELSLACYGASLVLFAISCCCCCECKANGHQYTRVSVRDSTQTNRPNHIKHNYFSTYQGRTPFSFESKESPAPTPMNPPSHGQHNVPLFGANKGSPDLKTTKRNLFGSNHI